MNNEAIPYYEERFLFRTRIHSLNERGIQIQQKSYLKISDTLVQYESLGSFVQYQTEFNYLHLLVILLLASIGIRGLSMSGEDFTRFVLSISMLAGSLYWIFYMLFAVQDFGAFYFSNSAEKPKGAFEIKSRYPPSEALQRFIRQIRERQKEVEKRNFFALLEAETELRYYEVQAKLLKNNFSISDEEFEAFWQAVTERYAFLKSGGPAPA